MQDNLLVSTNVFEPDVYLYTHGRLESVTFHIWVEAMIYRRRKGMVGEVNIFQARGWGSRCAKSSSTDALESQVLGLGFGG